MKRLILSCVFIGAFVFSVRGQSIPDWQGTWHGSLSNYPVRANAPEVEVIREVGAFPAQDDTCTVWRTTYKEQGEVRQVKDYKLCRGTGPDDLFIDEGDDIILKSRWIGDVLVTPFKYDGTLLVTHTRVQGDVMQDEILVMLDKPAIEGVQQLETRSMQRLTLHRQ